MNEINKLFELLKNKSRIKENKILLKANNNENKYNNYDDFNNSINNLLNIFVDESEISYIIINEYNEIKDDYVFNIKNILDNEKYDVFISISDNTNIYSNILRKTFKNKIESEKYFNELSQLIKEKNVKDLSSLLISKLQ